MQGEMMSLKTFIGRVSTVSVCAFLVAIFLLGAGACYLFFYF